MRPAINQYPGERRATNGLVLLMGLALTLSGCLFSPDKDKPKDDTAGVIKPQTSIGNILSNLVVAYEGRDIVEYEKLFDADFYFVFDPTDVAGDPDIPPNWPLSDDVASTRHMFEDELTEGITLDFVVGTPAAATPEDASGLHVFPAGTMKVIVTEVLLRVDTRDPAGGENIVYQVSGDLATFFLYPHPSETVDGSPKWYIFEWRDKKIGGSLAALAPAE